jgi:hypothetical protein
MTQAPPSEAEFEAIEKAAREALEHKQALLTAGTDGVDARLGRIAANRLKQDVEDAEAAVQEALGVRDEWAGRMLALEKKRKALDVTRAHALKAIATATRANDVEGLRTGMQMAEDAGLVGEGERVQKKKRKKTKKTAKPATPATTSALGTTGSPKKKASSSPRKGGTPKAGTPKAGSASKGGNQTGAEPRDDENTEEEEEVLKIRWCAPELTAARRLLPSLEKRSKREQQEAKLRAQLDVVRTRTECLGSDRDHNCYWKFSGDDERLWVQDLDINYSADECPVLTTPAVWRYYTTVEDVVSLIEYLDDRGVRERALKSELTKRFSALTSGMCRLEQVVVGADAAAGTDEAGGSVVGGADAMDVTADDQEEEWQTSGHDWLGRRVRRFFDGGHRADGRITKWMPATKEDPPLFHALHDDGDEEDLEVHEVEEAIKNVEDGVEEMAKDGETGAGEDADDAMPSDIFTYNNRWREDELDGEPHKREAGVELLETLRSNLIALDACSVARLRANGCDWCKRSAGSAGDDAVAEKDGEVVVNAAPGGRTDWLARVQDGDARDLAQCMLELEAAVHSVQTEDDVPPQDTAWQDHGHEWIGRRVRKQYLDDVVDGTIVKWLPAAGGEVALWHMLHEDGDEEDLEEHEVEECLQLAGNWQTEGDPWIGRTVRRVFGVVGGCSDGVLTAWLPADKDDGALWHLVMDDGDEEDLEEHEVRDALANRRRPQLLYVGKRVAVEVEAPTPRASGKGKKANSKSKKTKKKREFVLGTVNSFVEAEGEAGLYYWVRDDGGDEEEEEGLDLESLKEAMKRGSEMDEELEALGESDESEEDEEEEEDGTTPMLWADWGMWQRWKWCVYNAVGGTSSDGDAGGGDGDGEGDPSTRLNNVSLLCLALMALRDHR